MSREDIQSLFEPRVIDETAHTVDEIAELTNVRRQVVSKKLQEEISGGSWELVYKHVSGRLVKAYRKK